VIDDAVIMSLIDRVRELEDIQAAMARQVAQATSVAGIIARAGTERTRPAVVARRDRHGLRAVRGYGTAALLWSARCATGVCDAGAVLGVTAVVLLLTLIP
jgi:hypothetical protein